MGEEMPPVLELRRQASKDDVVKELQCLVQKIKQRPSHNEHDVVQYVRDHPGEVKIQALLQKVFDRKQPIVKQPKIQVLYHIGLTRQGAEMYFKDITYIVMGGTKERMKQMAIMYGNATNQDMEEVSSDRFTVFKAGNMVTCDHGMGGPSISILLNELFCALRIAGNTNDVRMFRVGTTGGLGIKPGSVIVSTDVLNERLEPYHEQIILGKTRRFPTKVDEPTVRELAEYNLVVLGKTMTCNDFYDNQGRMDGAFSEYTLKERDQFFQKLIAIGVTNIEMEASIFTALTARAGIKACVLCVVLVDRLLGEQPTRLINHSLPLEILVHYLTTKDHVESSSMRRGFSSQAN